jgi:DNA-damage-inducible protein J
MLRVADEQRLPFDIQVPNAESVRAMEQLKQGKGRKFRTAAALFKDLGL